MTSTGRLPPIAAWALLAALIPAAAAAAEVNAIATPGLGDLTMCRSMVYLTCNLYHHIEMPAQIAVGDKVPVRFGSNPKDYQFPAVRIVRDGKRCTVYSQADQTENVEKIEIAPCRVAPAPK